MQKTKGLINYIEALTHSKHSIYDITVRKQKVAELWDQFETVQSHIESLESQDPAITDKDALLEQQAQQRASFETPYFNLLARYQVVFDNFNKSQANLSHNELPQFYYAIQ